MSSLRANADSTTTANSSDTRTISAWSMSGRRVVDHAADLPRDRRAPLQQQVDVAEHLAQRQVRLGERDVAPDRLGDVVRRPGALGQEGEDLLRPPLVQREAL